MRGLPAGRRGLVAEVGGLPVSPTSAGGAFFLAAGLVGAITLVSRAPLRGESSGGVGVGARRAMLVGAAALLLLGGAVEWRASELAAQESAGELLISTFPGLYAWVLMVPLLAFGTAISAVSLRQLLLRRIRGAAGWIGLLAVLLVLGLQEAGRRVWVDGAQGEVLVRSGLLLPRSEANPLRDVEAVQLVEGVSRGAPIFTLSLRGERLYGALSTAQLRFTAPVAARVEAERWAALVGAVVREEPLTE